MRLRSITLYNRVYNHPNKICSWYAKLTQHMPTHSCVCVSSDDSLQNLETSRFFCFSFVLYVGRFSTARLLGHWLAMRFLLSARQFGSPLAARLRSGTPERMKFLFYLHSSLAHTLIACVVQLNTGSFKITSPHHWRHGTSLYSRNV
jgi:hypothetical protein